MSHKKLLASRRFDIEAQNSFATLSGDRNPMHLDRAYARRTQAGDIVAHGVHAMLWALEADFHASPRPISTLSVTARFERFIYVDEVVEAWAVDTGDARRSIELWSGKVRVATVSLGVTEGDAAPPRPVPEIAATEVLDSPTTLTLDEVAGRVGAIALSEDGSLAGFPSLCAHIGPHTVRAIAGLSTLVGMVCPGLHSIFSKLSIQMAGSAADTPLHYAVRRVQPTLRLATIDVTGAGIAGVLEAFVRKPPIQQPALADLRDQIDPMLCSEDTVLVLGGSRGLGELTAKLTALAGARVIISYAQGESEARSLADEIDATGAQCEIIPFNALEPVAPQLEEVLKGVSHCYYYPTPQIFRTRGEAFDTEAMARFWQIYITAFSDVAALLAARKDPARLFYPSSTAIDEQPKGAVEYVMAKGAGEILCDYLERSYDNLTIVRQRLPRLLTDQTSTVLPVATGNSVSILRDVIRRMHDETM